MALQFSPSTEAKFQDLLKRYPTRAGALIPTLHLAQDEFGGWISPETEQYVAQKLNLPLTHVREVVSFYTMFNREKTGKYHLQLCTNLSCTLVGSDVILQKIREHLGIGPGETTKDGLFTLTEVQCLASCGTGPVMQVNKDYHECLNPERLTALLDKLAADGKKNA
ncbi:MAG: NADH-quinone oxidoreductase subunit 2 [Myxococcota bacterium]|nr:NADH-quinone oxidoreductase subunit 2 [Myxococcota bacterium]